MNIIKIFGMCILFFQPIYGNEFHTGNIFLNLGNRHFVVSFLEDIFGKDNISKSDNGLYVMENNLWPITVEYILRPRSFWGGPCDIYDMSENENGELEYPKNYCHPTGASWNNSIYASSTVVREGYRIKSCEEITDNSDAIEFALAKIELRSDSEINVTNIKKAYQLFFPMRNSNGKDFEEAINALKLLENWQDVFLVLCFDPSWQVL